jgi:hypothetical protein
MIAAGLITTLTVNTVPPHVPGGEVGVRLYAAVTVPVVVLVSVPFSVLWLDADAPPVKPVPDGADQVYVVPVAIVPVGV